MAMHTIPELFLDQVKSQPEKVAVHVKRNGEFQPLTWSDLHQDVRRFVANLNRLGVQQGDRVVQFSENRYEWILLDLAIHILGAVHVPVHSTLSGSQVVEQAVDSGAQILIVSNQALQDKLTSGDPLPDNIAVHAFEATGQFQGKDVPLFDQPAENLDAVVALEESVSERITEDSYATILYTSGTTGEPKGVILNQRNITTNSLGANAMIAQQPGDLRLNFLPLSHIFARTCDLYGWIASGSQLAIAESRDTVIPDA